MESDIVAILGSAQTFRARNMIAMRRRTRLPGDHAGPVLEKVGFPCERCGEAAYIYFQRTVSNIH